MNSLIKEIVKKQLIREGKFHELIFDIKFTFELHHDDGGHTQLRKWRAGGGDKKVYDLDLVNLINDAKEEIVYAIIDGDIRHKRRFILSRDGKDYLNIVIEPEKQSPTHWNMVTITNMRKKDFTVSPGQVQIFIP